MNATHISLRYDIEFNDFVVNYTRNNNTDVPNFLTAIPYKEDITNKLPLHAKEIITTEYISYMLTKFYNVKKDRVIGVPYNKIIETNSFGEKIQFMFIESFSLTGSAMLIVKTKKGSYFISGHYSYSDLMFNTDNLRLVHLLMPINKLVIKGYWYKMPYFKNIDDLVATIANVIFDIPKNCNIVINCDFGVEFALARALLFLREIGFLEMFFADQPLYEFLKKLNCGHLILKYGEKYSREKYSGKKRILMFSNIGVTRKFRGKKRILEINRCRRWTYKTRSYIEKGDYYIFNIIPHNNRENIKKLLHNISHDIIYRPRKIYDIVRNYMFDYDDIVDTKCKKGNFSFDFLKAWDTRADDRAECISEGFKGFERTDLLFSMPNIPRKVPYLDLKKCFYVFYYLNDTNKIKYYNYIYTKYGLNIFKTKKPEINYLYKYKYTKKPKFRIKLKILKRLQRLKQNYKKIFLREIVRGTTPHVTRDDIYFPVKIYKQKIRQLPQNKRQNESKIIKNLKKRINDMKFQTLMELCQKPIVKINK